MNMSKFERRKRDLERKFEEEMKALQEAEQKEIEKKINPIVNRIGRVAEEEARKALEANPEILDFFSLKKREAGKEIKDALDRLFNAEKPEESEAEDEEEAADVTAKESEGVGDEADEAEAKGPEEEDPFAENYKQGATQAESGDLNGSTDQAGGKVEDRKGFMNFGRGN